MDGLRADAHYARYKWLLADAELREMEAHSPDYVTKQREVSILRLISEQCDQKLTQAEAASTAASASPSSASGHRRATSSASAASLPVQPTVWCATEHLRDLLRRPLHD